MTKRALVVGIDDYQNWQPAPGLAFPPLHCCATDATAFATLLTTAFGFGPDDVALCENAEGTLQALIDGLTTLFGASQPGDTACFYFAGYGGRVPQDGWGRPSPRFYEALVPYDTVGMFFDYQLAALAGTLLPPGVNLTVILDTAHSGALTPPGADSAYRAFGWSDAAIANFVAHCGTVLPLIALADTAVLDGNISAPVRSGNGVTLQIDATKDTTDQARALLLAAANYDETAGESTSTGHGYLTSALLGTLSAPGAALQPAGLLITLRGLVAASAGGHQTPQLRGRPVGAQEQFLDGFAPATASGGTP